MIGITFPTVSPGDRPKADDENALRRQVEALSNIDGVNGFNSFGNKYRLPPRNSSGGSSQSQQIEFEIIDWLPGDPLTSPCEAVYAEVTLVSCGASVQVGDIVIVWDFRMCHFDLTSDLLIGGKGTANWMSSTGTSTHVMCIAAPEPDSCVWVVVNMCCREEDYV
jgi:hypothetical protein